MHAPTHATIYNDSTLENELIDVVATHDDAAVSPSGSGDGVIRRVGCRRWR
ncbi:hypothetical protein [Cupriavidus sp. USMAA2-4]|uniref:hypothetical protein n=1 Tax=Cupriavidus sp. USMAA2-4 TaxID=876364 RepID=UPI000A7ACE49|nr:hypothetical protein [Cupriavidus sp. USMAA2-4]